MLPVARELSSHPMEAGEYGRFVKFAPTSSSVDERRAVYAAPDSPRPILHLVAQHSHLARRIRAKSPSVARNFTHQHRT